MSLRLKPALSANSVVHLNPSYSPQMEDKQPLTHPLFAEEEESNIVTSINSWGSPTPVDPPTPIVVQAPHRPHWRMENGEMVGVALAPSPLTTPHCTQHLLPLTPLVDITHTWVKTSPNILCASSFMPAGWEAHLASMVWSLTTLASWSVFVCACYIVCNNGGISCGVDGASCGVGGASTW